MVTSYTPSMSSSDMTLPTLFHPLAVPAQPTEDVFSVVFMSTEKTTS